MKASQAVTTTGVLVEGRGKKPKSAQGQDARITRYEDEHCAPAVREERSEHMRVLEVAKQV